MSDTPRTLAQEVEYLRANCFQHDTVTMHTILSWCGELAAMTAAHRAAEDRAIVAESRLSDEIALSRKLADNLATMTAERDEETRQRIAAEWAGDALEQQNNELQTERDILRLALRSALAFTPKHRFMGSCPYPPENLGDRDPECPVCQRLIELDAAIAESKERP